MLEILKYIYGLAGSRYVSIFIFSTEMHEAFQEYGRDKLRYVRSSEKVLKVFLFPFLCNNSGVLSCSCIVLLYIYKASFHSETPCICCSCEGGEREEKITAFCVDNTSLVGWLALY